MKKRRVEKQIQKNMAYDLILYKDIEMELKKGKSNRRGRAKALPPRTAINKGKNSKR